MPRRQQPNLRGFVSTVGLDEATIVEYIRNQEAEEERYEQFEAAYAALSGPEPPQPL